MIVGVSSVLDNLCEICCAIPGIDPLCRRPVRRLDLWVLLTGIDWELMVRTNESGRSGWAVRRLERFPQSAAWDVSLASRSSRTSLFLAVALIFERFASPNFPVGVREGEPEEELRVPSISHQQREMD